MAASHWEALRLWLEGARLVPRLDATGQRSDETILARAKSRPYIVGR